MNDAIIRLGNLSVYGFGILTVFSFLWGSFVFYKKAVESHFDDHIVFDSVVLAAFWGFIAGRLTYVALNLGTFWGHWPRALLLNDYPGIDRWGVFLGIALGIFFTVRKNKGKFLDWFDLVSLGISAGTAIFYIGLSVLSFSWQYIIFSILYLTFFIYMWWMVDRYRTLGWYRGKKTSARSGLISGFSISFWGLSTLLSSLWWGLMLVVGGLVLVYIRSGRTWSEDIKIIYIWKKIKK